jgi:hypothetical protein
MLEINFSFEYKLSWDLFVLYLNYKAMKFTYKKIIFIDLHKLIQKL